MIFSLSQVAGIRQGKVTATLVPRSEVPRMRRERSSRRPDGTMMPGPKRIAKPIRYVMKETVERDGEGIATGKIQLERMELGVTILGVVKKIWVMDATPDIVKACGHTSVEGLHTEWKRRHPRMDLAAVLFFEQGDTRDPDRYLTSTSAMKWVVGDGRDGTGDYTTNVSRAADDAAALPPDELAEAAAHNGQKYLANLAQVEKDYTELPEAERLARLLMLPPALQELIRQELRIIEQRAERGSRKIPQ